VFSPPESLINFEFVPESEPMQVLPAREQLQLLPASPQESNEIRARSHLLAKDIFWAYFSGHEFHGVKSKAGALYDLANSLEFHFEDGQSLGLAGISRKANFPLFLDPQFYFYDKSCNWSRVLESFSDDFMRPLKIQSFQKKHDDYKKSWLVVLEILAWALQRKRQVGDLEVLWSNPLNYTESEKRRAFPIHDIEFLKARPMAATVRADMHVQNSARISVWEGFEKNIPTNTLRLFSTGLLHEDLNRSDLEIADPQEIDVLNNFNQSLSWKILYTTKESGPKEISRSLTKLEHIIGSGSVFFMNHVVISGEEFKPFLRIREEEGSLQLAISFLIQTLQLQHLNFPASLHPLLSPFYGGLEYFFGLDRKDVASHHAQYRANDLLFLRLDGARLWRRLSSRSAPTGTQEQARYCGERERHGFFHGL
jgi:hypothetical protein